jgi:hypothetical protein
VAISPPPRTHARTHARTQRKGARRGVGSGGTMLALQGAAREGTRKSAHAF